MTPPKQVRAWAVVGPSGAIVKRTVNADKSRAWVRLAHEMPGIGFDAKSRAADERGYRLVRVRVTVEEEQDGR